MKFFSLGLLVFMLASVGRSAPLSYRYVQELAPMLHPLTTMTYWSRYFPASDAAPPPINEFIAEEVSVGSMGELSSKTQEELDELTEKANTRRSKWFDEFYPQPTEERMVEVLGKDDDLRARMTAFISAVQMEFRDDGGKTVTVFEGPFSRSFGLAMFIKAIDADMTKEELEEKIDKFVSDKAIDIKYRGDGNTPYVQGRSKTTYRSLDRYLLRLNTVNHPLLPSDVQGDLWVRSYNDPDVYELFPVSVARKFIEQEFSPARVENAGYDLAFLIDLLCEKCIIGNFVPTILDAEADLLDALVAAEMGLEVDSDAFAERIALINDQDNPASLFQIVQLERLDWPLKKIAELNYAARDAIIVSAHLNHNSFVAKHGADIAAPNEIATEIGELSFYLVQRNFVRRIEDVKPHQAPTAQEIADIVDENTSWQSIMPGYADGVVPVTPQQNQD